MGIGIWLGLGALSVAAFLWAARGIYSSGKAGRRRWGRGTLFISIAISALAYPAFQFVIVKSFVGSETGWLFEVADVLVTIAIFFNLFFSAYLLGILSKVPRDGESPASSEGPGD